LEDPTTGILELRVWKYADPLPDKLSELRQKLHSRRRSRSRDSGLTFYLSRNLSAGYAGSGMEKGCRAKPGRREWKRQRFEQIEKSEAGCEGLMMKFRNRGAKTYKPQTVRRV